MSTQNVLFVILCYLMFCSKYWSAEDDVKKLSWPNFLRRKKRDLADLKRAGGRRSKEAAPDRRWQRKVQRRGLTSAGTNFPAGISVIHAKGHAADWCPEEKKKNAGQKNNFHFPPILWAVLAPAELIKRRRWAYPIISTGRRPPNGCDSLWGLPNDCDRRMGNPNAVFLVFKRLTFTFVMGVFV